jgi:hypothetical protein
VKRAAFVVALLALAACSENNLRVIYEEAPLAEQPDALGPTIWVDEFQQRTVEASDILFVIDDSCSMEDEQEELAANFDSFIQHFEGTNLDFHIGVTKGDLEPGASEDWGVLETLPDGTKWIDADTADPIAAFNAIANVGASGSGECEMGLQGSFSALGYQNNPGGPNEGFYREDALLTLVIVSDEIGRAAGGATIPLFPSCEGILPSEYIPWWLNSLKGPSHHDKLIWTGIVGDRPGGCNANGNSADEGVGYWEVIDAVAGNHLSVCSDDWSEFLTQLGFEAAGLKTSFQLRRIPLESTIVVEIDDDEIPVGTVWTYDRTRNAIDFPVEQVPEELSLIRVTYQLQEDTGFIVPDDE